MEPMGREVQRIEPSDSTEHVEPVSREMRRMQTLVAAMTMTIMSKAPHLVEEEMAYNRERRREERKQQRLARKKSRKAK